MNAFSDRLAAAIETVNAPLCVGIDPVIEKIPETVRHQREPAAACESFARGVIEAIQGVAAAIKPQAACFERWGTPGWQALERTVLAAREAGLIVVLDAKRGDIGASSAHYAASAASLGADAVTVNAYLGTSGIEPFLSEGLGVFCLVRTSNPDADQIQSQELADGRTVSEAVAGIVAGLGAGHVGERGMSDVGAVVGATQTGSGKRPTPEALRGAMPDQVFLTPGLGAQGATAEDLRPLFRSSTTGPADCGVLATASRSVTYPSFEGQDDTGPLAERRWIDAVGRESRTLAASLRAVL
ncbi:MAG: orotidine-5'-phosphate decarboxylase [Planctomycetota bacterium]